jgi:FKBP-type peptidyl-prolyl cis-trans isomerase
LKKITLISILFIFLYSCESKFPDYTKKEDGVYMKLLSFEDGDKIYKKECHVNASIEILDGDRLLCKYYKENIISPEDNQLSFLIQEMNEGDSCVFKVSKDKIRAVFEPFKLGEVSNEFVDILIKTHHYYSLSEHTEQKENIDKEMMEQLLLKKYLEDDNAKFYNGVYKKQLEEGDGEKVKKGDVITIAYKGSFVNSLQFDEISGATAFTFTYGTPGQVIKGLDIAIKSMREGEKSKIIIPSQLAFGEEGSTTLIVPSFTTVIYELEILKIK